MLAGLAPPLPIGPASPGFDGSPDSPDRDKPIPRPKPPPPGEKPPFVLPPANPDQRRVFAYLRKRGITAQVILRFIDAGLLYEDAQYHSCVIVGRDGSGQPRFASKRGTASYEIPLYSVSACGGDSTRPIPSSFPHKNRFAGFSQGPK